MPVWGGLTTDHGSTNGQGSKEGESLGHRYKINFIIRRLKKKCQEKIENVSKSQESRR